MNFIIPRWKTAILIFLMLLLPLEQMRKKVLIVGKWRSLSDNHQREFEPGGKAKIVFDGVIVEEYKIKMGFFLEQQWLSIDGQEYGNNGTREGIGNGHSVCRFYIGPLGRYMKICSSDGCVNFEKY